MNGIDFQKKLLYFVSRCLISIFIFGLFIVTASCKRDYFGLRSETENRAPTITAIINSNFIEYSQARIKLYVTDPDYDSVSISWNQIDGPPVELDFHGEREVTFNLPSYIYGNSTLRFNVVASDSNRLRSEKIIEINVQPDFWDIDYSNEEFSAGAYFIIKANEDKKMHLIIPTTAKYRFITRSSYGNANISIYSDSSLAPSTLIETAHSLSSYGHEVRTMLVAGQEVFIQVFASVESDSNLRIYPLSPYLEPGFPVDTVMLPGTYRTGVSSALIAAGNIDSDAELEIVASGFAAGPLYAWDYNGTVVPGWPEEQSGAAVYPSIGNLEGTDEKLEIAAGSGPYVATCSFPGFYTFNGSGMPLAGWPITECTSGAVAAPVLVDLNNDGKEEIFFAGRGYDAAGSALNNWIDDTSYYSVADIDGDNSPDFVTQDKHTITAYDASRNTLPGFPTEISIVSTSTSTVSQIVIGNVIDDETPELISINALGGNPSPIFIDVIKNDGSLMYSWSAMYPTAEIMSPALGDLDGDGNAEIILQTDDHLYVFNGDGSQYPGWPVQYENAPYSYVGTVAPLIADVDGDQLQDIIVVTHYDLLVYSRDGLLTRRIPIPYYVTHMPAIADIDLDGHNEIILGVHIFDSFPYIENIWVFDLGGPTHGPIEWGQYGGDARHQNTWPVPK